MNMPRREQPSDVILHPGEYYFGDRHSRIRTVLGTCVSVTCWHPRLLIGGMCHYMLPEQPNKKAPLLDGRYADAALKWLLCEIKIHYTQPREYQVKMFGGGNMFPGSYRENTQNVGEKNIEMGRLLLKQHGFTVETEALGGIGHRTVIFDIGSGHVWVKHVSRDCSERESIP